jgi:hypothetical protein
VRRSEREIEGRAAGGQNGPNHVGTCEKKNLNMPLIFSFNFDDFHLTQSMKFLFRY